MKGNLTKLVVLLMIARRVTRVAKESAVGGVWPSSLYASARTLSLNDPPLQMMASLGVMTLALTGRLAPTAGALAQEGVDLAAILNALRVLRTALPQ